SSCPTCRGARGGSHIGDKAAPPRGAQSRRIRRRLRDYGQGAPRGVLDDQRSLPPAEHREDHRFSRQQSDTGNVRNQRGCGRRRPSVLRRQPARLVPSRRRVRAQNFAWHQAGGPADRAAGQIRVGRQPQDRQGDGVEHSRIFSAARRRGDRVKRREFIAMLGGAAVAWPLAARAQQAGKVPTIGFLGQSTRSAGSEWVAAFVQRLRELGWSEGRTISIEYRWGEGREERFAEVAAEFVRLKVDVIVTSGTLAVMAAKRATSVIPIVF